MKFIKLLLRVATRLVMVVLGFTAVFPEWFDFAAILKAEYETKQTEKMAINSAATDKHGITASQCGSKPISRVARDYASSSNSAPAAQPPSDTAKVFINRDPVVFDFVCAGDTLKFNIYAENIDKLMVTYESRGSDNMSYETRSSVSFNNAMEFTVPTHWSGPAQIDVSGFVSGWAGLATNKVTFNINRRVVEKQLKNATAKPLKNQVSVQRLNPAKTSLLKVVRITDGHKIQIGSDVRHPENWLIELDVDNLKPNTRIKLDGTNARVTVKQLSARKLYEARAGISYIKGVLITGRLSTHGLPIRFDFSVSNKPLASPSQHTNNVERYWVKGQATVKQ